MTTTRAISADTARKTALEECETKIRSAFRRGLEATCVIAKELYKIYIEELYIVKTPKFSEYLELELQIDIRSYRRILAVSQTVEQLKEAGLTLPANESQAAELARLAPALRPKIWSDLVIKAEREEKSLILEDVKRAVDIVESQAPAAASQSEIEIDMDEKDNGAQPPSKPKKPKPPAQEGELILTEKGEAALNRIRKICGNEVADAIEDGTVALTEREIKNWAEYDDELMRTLVYYVIDRKWTLAKAVGFATKKVDDSTDIQALILIAHARGGSARINYDNRANITVELTSQ